MERYLMTSTRLILIFLGIILFITLILTRGRFLESLKNRVSSILPRRTTVEDSETARIIPTTSATAKPQTEERPDAQNGNSSDIKGEIPSTGPSYLVYIFSSLGTAGGLILLKKSRNRKF